MELVEIQVEYSDVKPDPERICSLLGSDKSGNDPSTPDLVRECIRACREIMEPRAGYVSQRVARPPSAGTIHAGPFVFKTGSRIASLLKGAVDFHFFLATAGPGPENLARELMKKGDYLNGYVTDLVGSAIAEAVAERVHGQIRREAQRSGSSCSNRYSPGYCGWRVDEQQTLFRLFPENPLGITLSSSSLMHPVKSVSGVAATGPEVNYQDYSCEICNMKNCPYRKL